MRIKFSFRWIAAIVATMALAGCGGTQEDAATLNAAPPPSADAVAPAPNPNKPVLGRPPESGMNSAPDTKTNVVSKRAPEGAETQ